MGDGFISFVLRSPFHKMLSGSFMLITVTGSKTGKAITTPVNYAAEGNTLWVASFRQRSWWRNLRGGRAVILKLRGQEVRGTGRAIEEKPEVEQALREYLQRLPQNAKYFDVSLDEQGQLNPADLKRAAQDRVMVEISIP